jgi:hypothetical protein
VEPKELPNGNILVPARAEGPDGLIGDGIHEISPDDPAFQVLVRLVAEPPRDRGAGSLRRTTARLTMASTATRPIAPIRCIGNPDTGGEHIRGGLLNHRVPIR